MHSLGAAVVAAVLAPQTATAADLNANQSSMALAIRNTSLPAPEDPALCPSLVRKRAEPEGLTDTEQQLLDRCGRVVRASDPTEQGDALQAITSEELNAPKANSINFNRTNFSNIASRLASLRSATGGIAMASNASDPVVSLLQNGGAAGDGDVGYMDGRLGVFVNGSFGSGDKSRTAYEAAYDFDLWAITGGVDYRFSDSFVGGLALSYADSSTDYDDGGSLSGDGLTGSVFGSWFGQSFYVDGILSYGSASYDSLRRVRYDITQTSTPGETDSIDHTARGSTDSNSLYAGLSLGYVFTSGGWQFGPIAAISYVDVDVDGFSEKGGNNPELNLRYQDQSAESLQLQAGFDVSYAASMSWGIVSPYARAVYVSEQEDGRTRFSIQYVSDPFRTPETTARVTSDKPDTSFYRWAIGASAVFANGVAGFVDYESVSSLDSIDYSLITVGLRYQFR
jgi:uncharacterized protein YhjY with autotransporter beta-barrel domain